MDFATFRRALVNVPAEIVRSGRKILYRLLAWNPWQHVFFACSTSFASRCDAEARSLKPESGCSGPPRPCDKRRENEPCSTDNPTDHDCPVAAPLALCSHSSNKSASKTPTAFACFGTSGNSSNPKYGDSDMTFVKPGTTVESATKNNLETVLANLASHW